MWRPRGWVAVLLAFEAAGCDAFNEGRRVVFETQTKGGCYVGCRIGTFRTGGSESCGPLCDCAAKRLWDVRENRAPDAGRPSDGALIRACAWGLQRPAEIQRCLHGCIPVDAGLERLRGPCERYCACVFEQRNEDLLADVPDTADPAARRERSLDALDRCGHDMLAEAFRPPCELECQQVPGTSADACRGMCACHYEVLWRDPSTRAAFNDGDRERLLAAAPAALNECGRGVLDERVLELCRRTCGSAEHCAENCACVSAGMQVHFASDLVGLRTLLDDPTNAATAMVVDKLLACGAQWPAPRRDRAARPRPPR